MLQQLTICRGSQTMWYCIAALNSHSALPARPQHTAGLPGDNHAGLYQGTPTAHGSLYK